MRMCSNVPAQWAIQSALGGYQSILDLTAPGGRLYESRKAVIDAVANSKYLKLTPPAGALYAFIEVRADKLPYFNDQQFALELLEEKHVLVTPGATFNVPYTQSLPHHDPAGSHHAEPGVLAHRGAAGSLVCPSRVAVPDEFVERRRRQQPFQVSVAGRVPR